MDWQGLAAIAFERCADPMFVLSRDGRLVTSNRHFADLYEGKRIAGCHVTELWEWSHPDEPPDVCVEHAFRGIVDRWECVASRTSLERVRMFMDIRRFGATGDEALIGVVRDLHTESVFTPCEESVAYYDVALRADAPVDLLGPNVPQEPAEGTPPPRRICHVVLHGRDTPCTECPLLASEPFWPRIGVRAPEEPRAPWVLMLAEQHPNGVARIWFHPIGETVLSNLVRAKVTAVVGKAHLTDREQEVLQMMLIGRGPDEIAKALALADRTVRFHQRNILEKIGADSKFDLLRLLI